MSNKQQRKSAENRYKKSIKEEYDLDYHKIYDLPILTKKAKTLNHKLNRIKYDLAYAAKKTHRKSNRKLTK
jgi:hypothetical protein